MFVILFYRGVVYWGELSVPLQRDSCDTPYIRAEKTMTATDVTGFDAIFSTGFFATFSRF